MYLTFGEIEIDKKEFQLISKRFIQIKLMFLVHLNLKKVINITLTTKMVNL